MSNNKSAHADSHRSIIKSTSIVAAGTLSSRILGFVRDIILAKFFGTGFQADAFFVAQKIPNLFRDFVGEGAANSAIVPVFSEYLAKESRKEFWRFVSVLLALALVVLSLITILGILLAPLVVRLIAPGFIVDPAKLRLTIELTKIMFPYLLLIGLTAYSMAILYSFRSFVASAFSPCLLNIAMIVSALLSSRYMAEPVYGLAIGVMIGGILQLAIQIPPLFKIGIKIQRPTPLNHPGAAKVGRLLLPRMFGAGVYQLNVFIDTFCASLASIVGPGGISAIYYSNRIIQFPMGIFGFALASAALPTLSKLAAENNTVQLKKTLIFTLENIFFLMFPFSVMIMLLSFPLVRILFERGLFDAYSTEITAKALFFFSLGLFSFGGIKILVTAFYAMQDTKTPVKIAAVCLIINATLNFVLMIPLKVSGIALASAISGTIDFLWLFHVLDKRLGGITDGLLVFVAKVLVATAGSGATVMWIWTQSHIAEEILRLAVAAILGVFVFALLSFILRIDQARKFFHVIVGKR